MKQKRIRDYGIKIGRLPCGKRNKITDVPGVTVGQVTLRKGEIQTGVTVVMPAQDNLFTRKMTAACHVLNGYGKTTGLLQIQELGYLETPVALTNTLNVGLVSDGLIEYTLEQCREQDTEITSINPVVAECNDSRINAIALRAIKQQHVLQAIAQADKEFAEGAIGGGTGMVCFGLKGGIGSASRKFRLDEKEYTLGILVQSNFGSLEELRIAGKQIGLEIQEALMQSSEPEKGSVIAVVATDAPLSDRQLTRVLRRVPVGLARLGSYTGHGSGEVFIGFSTAQRWATEEKSDILTMNVLREESLDLLFLAVADAAEEAVLNSMVTAEATIGRNYETFHSLKEFL
jgi:D-aminopeptidase